MIEGIFRAYPCYEYLAKNLPTKPADTCRYILLDPQTANPHAAFQPEQNE